MVSKLDKVELNRKGFINWNNKRIEEPVIALDIHVDLDELDEYKVPENLVKVTHLLILHFKNRPVVNEDIVNFIFELEKKCDEGLIATTCPIYTKV